jgi:2-keto-4-pentenoate hydratase/2-oxohepta-3-ene-1,7-dioic acid hydratase in catechol pathway
MTRRTVNATIATSLLFPAAAAPGVTRYVRFAYQGRTANAVLEGEELRVLEGSIIGPHKVTSVKRRLSDVTLLYPILPPKALAVGRNYKSHLGSAPAPKRPEMFYKPTTCLQNPAAPIKIPSDAQNVHYEGELVIVIGKRLANAKSREEAAAAIFGVTCGNDVSERDWQGGADKDMQWWRAKGADTFGPMGPAIVTGLDYGKLMLETRLNGKSVQKQSTADLLFYCPGIVRFTSKYVTLDPGDVIFTGTPQTTNRMKAGDVVEVEIEGIGILRNPVT